MDVDMQIKFGMKNDLWAGPMNFDDDGVGTPEKLGKLSCLQILMTYYLDTMILRMICKMEHKIKWK